MRINGDRLDDIIRGIENYEDETGELGDLAYDLRDARAEIKRLRRSSEDFEALVTLALTDGYRGAPTDCVDYDRLFDHEAALRAEIARLREAMNPDSFGCFTGDCQHDRVHDCVTAIGETLRTETRGNRNDDGRTESSAAFRRSTKP